MDPNETDTRTGQSSDPEEHTMTHTIIRARPVYDATRYAFLAAELVVFGREFSLLKRLGTRE